MRGRAMRLTKLTLALVLCAALVAGAGCGGEKGAEPTPTLSPTPSGIFEIYLVNTSNLSQINFSDLENIPLQEIPLLTETHIISYNWSNHSIKLTDEGCRYFLEELEEKSNTFHSPFIVVADGERIYRGEFVPGY